MSGAVRLVPASGGRIAAMVTVELLSPPPRTQAPLLPPRPRAVPGMGRPRAPVLNGETGRAIISLVEQIWGIDSRRRRLPWETVYLGEAQVALAGLAHTVLGTGPTTHADWLNIDVQMAWRDLQRHRHMLRDNPPYRTWFRLAEAAFRAWLDGRA